MLSIKKTPEDVLQEEILKERAEVLRRTGERLAAILDVLQGISCRIDEQVACLDGKEAEHGTRMRGRIIEDINARIRQFNNTREQAKMRYYYLIVTREALGLRRHNWVEDIYRIPPKIKILKES